MSSSLAPLPSLISASELAAAAAANDRPLRLLDATTALEVPGEGQPYIARPQLDAYLAEHVPGAAFVDIQADLSDPDGEFAFTLPAPADLAAGFARLGIGDDTHVVVYDNAGSAWATRVWWLLRHLGHDAVSVLDGGLGAWKLAGLPVADGADDLEAARAVPATLTPEPREHLVARVGEVEALSAGEGGLLLNALDVPTFRGEQELSPYARRGRIPGSASLPFFGFLDRETGLFLPREEIVVVLQETGILDAERAVTYCGGGIAATLPAFAAFHAAGVELAVYDGSLSEWTASERPVLVGA